MQNRTTLGTSDTSIESDKAVIRPDINKDFKDIAYGCIDNINETSISGWYLHRSNAAPLLKITVDHTIIGYCRPSFDRPDISAIINRQVKCGFTFNWADLNDSTSLKMFIDSSEPLTNIEVTCVETDRHLYKLLDQDVYMPQLRKWLLRHACKKSLAVKVNDNCAPVHTTKREITTAPPLCCTLSFNVTNGKLRGRILWNTGNKETPYKISLSFHHRKKQLDSLDLEPIMTNLENSSSRSFAWEIPKALLSGNEEVLEIRAAAPGHAVTSRVLTMGRGHFDSEINYIGAGILKGRVVERVIDSKANNFEICVDSNEVLPLTLDTHHSIREKGSFTFCLPSRYLDNAPHSIELRSNNRTLETIHFAHTIRGHIEVLNGQKLVGWIFEPSTDQALELTVKIDDNELPSTLANLRRDDVGRACGFNFDISRYTEGKSSFKLTIELTHVKIAVLNTPQFYFRTDGLIETIRRISSGENFTSQDGLDKIAMAKYLGPRLIRLLREEVGQGVIVSTPQAPIHKSVKIILPVYDGIDETLRCLLALFKSKDQNKTPFDVILIDDRGPNPAMSAILQKVAARPDVTLVVNDHNLGFVRSVNKALRMASGYDIVLLNADAVVNGDWLDRISHIANIDPNVASVTPFSNNATICSYPDPELENSMPADLSLEEIDQLCARVNYRKAVEIPSGVGFCMYMKAAAIAEVGILDAEKFGMGYGEENDWCVRARDLGWKHMHACDTFVEHIGGVSFGKDKKNNLVEKNLAILGKIYPEYTPIVMDFIKSDPARLYRNRITIERIRQQLSIFSERHLYITHSFGGGIEVFCKNQEKLLRKRDIAALTLESVGGTRMRLYYGEFSVEYVAENDMEELTTALSNLSLNRIHMNSDIGHAMATWDLATRLNIPLDVTVHDYTSICPRVNLMTSDGKYCGEPAETNNCDRCIKRNGSYAYLEPRFKNMNSSVSDWRKFYKSKLLLAENVYVPDSDVAHRLQKYFPDVDVKVLPHEHEGEIPQIERPRVIAGEIMRIAVIGAIGPHKGFELLSACIAQADQHNLPLEFIVIGYTCDDKLLKQYQNVQISGKFEQEMLTGMLSDYECHAALFLSPWPETYSYTLTESLLSGLWPVVLPIGAQASRVKALGYGTILDDGATAKEINRSLLELGFGD